MNAGALVELPVSGPVALFSVTLELLPPRLTHELAILVRNGVQLHTAARGLGVLASSLNRWLSYGHRATGNTPDALAYRALVAAIRDAKCSHHNKTWTSGEGDISTC